MPAQCDCHSVLDTGTLLSPLTTECRYRNGNDSIAVNETTTKSQKLASILHSGSKIGGLLCCMEESLAAPTAMSKPGEMEQQTIEKSKHSAGETKTLRRA